ncbi:HlyD family type I secretion periplasmic adaptor subunit [Pseudoalteromonas shioyasakiensis]|uniref:HlyD family type I secretion periplasmic adaptor subunit n=1 Tax=Pseudoalteromonas shioyasakiensis TaxID=1190813 RepID=UPI002118CB14|nr:HlyD family type I secretion periplasmic adaptor subunit [Pseudoalteromonas shioyasakiensis]MCQ8880046.1 HlyD family type I secretion periplasmic adaptor subunit [Pseudoalteromonas shioyasakiensis]
MSQLQVSQLAAARQAQKLIAIVFLVLLSTIVWATFATLDEVIVGEGNVVPAQTVQTVENLDGGILKQVLVNEGELVQQGQPLLLLDETRFAAAFAESNQQRDALQAKKLRLQAELKTITLDSSTTTGVVLTPQPITTENVDAHILSIANNSYNARLSQLRSLLQQSQQMILQQSQAINEQQANINSLRQRLKLISREVNLTSEGVNDGAVAEMELVKLQREEVMLQGELNRADALLLQLRAAKEQGKEERRSVALDYLAKAQDELDEVSNELAKLAQSSKALEDRLVKTQIKAPLTGTVKNIASRSVGGVIEPGQVIMEIVPLDDKLIVETKIAPKDIGFIRQGMPAMVKFSAYDFVIYGGLSGEVIFVSPDASQLEDGTTYYEAHIKTDGKILENQPIIPGMQASVDILTGKKTVLQYWLKPLLRAKANAMREP